MAVAPAGVGAVQGRGSGGVGAGAPGDGGAAGCVGGVGGGGNVWRPCVAVLDLT